MKNGNIAIDGPVSSGKSTIAKLVAQKTGKKFISTGSIYRAVAYFCMKQKVDIKNTRALKKLINSLDITFNSFWNIVVNNKELTEEIRTDEISNLSSQVAKIKIVRILLKEIQINIAKEGNIVMEGRDITSVIMPDADLKIYLTCDVKIRAKRRYLENKKRGIKSTLRQVKCDLEKRDNDDINRLVSPLIKTKDSTLVDTSNLTIKEVVNKIVKLNKGL